MVWERFLCVLLVLPHSVILFSPSSDQHCRCVLQVHNGLPQCSHHVVVVLPCVDCHDKVGGTGPLCAPQQCDNKLFWREETTNLSLQHFLFIRSLFVLRQNGLIFYLPCPAPSLHCSHYSKCCSAPSPHLPPTPCDLLPWLEEEAQETPNIWLFPNWGLITYCEVLLRPRWN